MKREFTGELVGTFLLVFFGCGAVAVSVCFDAFDGLFQIAAIWGIAVALAIALTGPLSGAHLNPAITLAFATVDGFPTRKIPHYFAGQFAGAFLAAGGLYLLFDPAIQLFESAHGLTRGHAGSEATAKIFGEFHSPEIPMGNAFFAEFLGTALLAFFIFGIINKCRNTPLPDWLIPLSIGLALTILISIFAPISMGGFNPARDLAPRIFSSLAGWESIPFTTNGMSWLIVYVLGPFLGGPVGAWLAKKVFA
jgi:glycerol uptake facilitator protein